MCIFLIDLLLVGTYSQSRTVIFLHLGSLKTNTGKIVFFGNCFWLLRVSWEIFQYQWSVCACVWHPCSVCWSCRKSWELPTSSCDLVRSIAEIPPLEADGPTLTLCYLFSVFFFCLLFFSPSCWAISVANIFQENLSFHPDKTNRPEWSCTYYLLVV